MIMNEILNNDSLILQKLDEMMRLIQSHNEIFTQLGLHNGVKLTLEVTNDKNYNTKAKKII